MSLVSVAPVAPVMMVLSVVTSCGSSRPVAPVVLCLQAPVSALSFVAPVSVVHGSGISFCCCQSPVSVAPVSSIGFVVRGPSICRLCLQYHLSFVAPVVVAPVSSQYLLFVASVYLLSFVAPVSVAPVGAPPVSPVVHGFTSICRLWLHWLLLVAPVSPVVHDSGICCAWLSSSIIRRLVLWLLWLRQWLKYYLVLSLPVAPSCLLLLLWLPWSSSLLWL